MKTDYGVSLWDDQNILEQDRAHGCTAFVNILNASELYTLSG